MNGTVTAMLFLIIHHDKLDLKMFGKCLDGNHHQICRPSKELQENKSEFDLLHVATQLPVQAHASVSGQVGHGA